MPTLVKNYLLITYDDLVNNFEYNMNLFKSYLPIKNNIEFPLNITYYKKNKSKNFEKKDSKSEYKKGIIARNRILKKANLYYEKILFKEKY